MSDKLFAATDDMQLSHDLPQGPVLEGIVTTTNEDGTTNIAPMGPTVDEQFERLLFRAFRQSTTFSNLQRTRFGVLHVTDDVQLIAQAAVGPVSPSPPLVPTPDGKGMILADACRWYAFQVDAIDDSQDRAQMLAHVVEHGRLRDFFGFNRAKHAVLEAAILATRLHLLPAKEILAEFHRLGRPVQKTGGLQELRAFDFLQEYVTTHLAAPAEQKPK